MIKDFAKKQYFNEHPEELEIAKSFNEGFNVNHANFYDRNNIRCSYYFLGAHQNMIERFGLDLETLCIVDNHNEPDARIISAMKDLLFKYSTRLNQVVVFIVIGGDVPDFKRKISTEAQIALIVLNKKELIHNTSDPYFLRKTITKHLGSIDLFGISSPLENDTYLFGRDDVISDLMNKILIKKSNAGVFGLRKTGKTSLLFAIERRFNTRNVLSVYIDCHKQVYKFRWWKLLEYIAFKLSTKLASIEIIVPKEQYKDYSPENAMSKFESLTYGQLKNFEQIIIFFDEIEYITPKICRYDSKHWNTDFVDFWQIIRGIHQESHGSLSFVLGGVNPFITDTPYIDENQNPIFQLVQPNYLKPLGKEYIRKMVRYIGKFLGMKFSEDVYDHLEKVYGGHAFLTRLACSQLFQHYRHLTDQSGFKFSFSYFCYFPDYFRPDSRVFFV